MDFLNEMSKEEITHIIDKLFDNNAQNFIVPLDDYYEGCAVGYHNALVDVLNALGIENSRRKIN